MPVYEFECQDCARKFDIVATFAEFDAGLKPLCPKCGGRRCRQVIGRVTLLTSSKSERGFDDDFRDDGLDEAGGPDDEFGTEDLGGDDDSDDFGE